MKVSNLSIEKDGVKCGNKKLWAAVLHTALVDIHAPHAMRVYEPKRETTTRHLSRKESAQEWIASDDFTPGSFLWVCEALDMDAEQIREGIARMTVSNIKGTRIQAIADKTRRIQ